ncbi:hypothetical protein H0H92_000378 [Tricholoma furcatifolium]|nr:hypothetical protein H0H92_000378 [Tricholoma furcatifolium]
MSSVCRGTDNTGTEKPPDRYEEFLRVIRQWQNLKMLKRSGCGVNLGGITAMSKGSCAVLCPACPHPGINLPPDWKLAPEDKKWLYSLFLAIDANFRLKRKITSSEDRDPSLSGGAAFFVEEKAFREHINKNWNQKQAKSTCVSHDAVNKPDKEARGLAASGAGTVDCARHDMKRPNGVGDLQLGERYINMDYIILSSLRNTDIERVVFSYDIVCQWRVRFRERMMSYPPELHISNSIKAISFMIPKFHLPAHIEQCNLDYSFNLTKGMGRTDGEAPERGWANINPIAQSTREMGPGSRRDTIDDHFNDWNWKKTIQFGPRMFRKMQEAAKGYREQSEALEDFESTVPDDVIKEWLADVERWEDNPRNTWRAEGWVQDETVENPYQYKMKPVSERGVRLKLAQEVERLAQDAARNGMVTEGDVVHGSAMIANGLVLEDDQYGGIGVPSDGEATLGPPRMIESAASQDCQLDG